MWARAETAPLFVPARDAIIAALKEGPMNIPGLAEKTGKALNRLSLAELQSMHPVAGTKIFGRDALAVFDLKMAMAKRNLTGAPGTKEVAKQLARWRKLLS